MVASTRLGISLGKYLYRLRIGSKVRNDPKTIPSPKAQALSPKTKVLPSNPWPFAATRVAFPQNPIWHSRGRSHQQAQRRDRCVTQRPGYLAHRP